MNTLAAVVARSVALAQPIAQAYSEGNMLMTVRFTRPVKNTFDRDAGAMNNPADTVVYEGPGRMGEVSGGVAYNLGEETQSFASSFISVPITATRPRVDDDAEILEHKDISLIGRHYRVTGVTSGGLMPAVHRCDVTGAEPSSNVSL